MKYEKCVCLFILHPQDNINVPPCFNSTELVFFYCCSCSRCSQVEHCCTFLWTSGFFVACSVILDQCLYVCVCTLCHLAEVSDLAITPPLLLRIKAALVNWMLLLLTDRQRALCGHHAKVIHDPCQRSGGEEEEAPVELLSMWQENRLREERK